MHLLCVCVCVGLCVCLCVCACPKQLLLQETDFQSMTPVHQCLTETQQLLGKKKKRFRMIFPLEEENSAVRMCERLSLQFFIHILNLQIFFVCFYTVQCQTRMDETLNMFFSVYPVFKPSDKCKIITIIIILLLQNDKHNKMTSFQQNVVMVLQLKAHKPRFIIHDSRQFSWMLAPLCM